MYWQGVGNVDASEAEELRLQSEAEARAEAEAEKASTLEDIAELGSILKEEGGKDDLVAKLRDLYRAVKRGNCNASVMVQGKPRWWGNWVLPSLVHRGLRENTSSRF